jgi:hypothetical protein
MASLIEEIEAALGDMAPAARAELERLALAQTANMRWIPNPGPQTDAYYSLADLLYYGGGAGGGKSHLLTGLAVNEHRVSRLFRRQFKDIDGEGGMGPALAQILGVQHIHHKHVWAVPSSAVSRKIEFGAFENETEAAAYQGRAADLFGFDEAVQFLEHLVKFIIAWNRPASGVPATQRCRTVLASNPPLTPDGLWIFEWFGPWLDDRHPNPAEPGELRWFMEIDGRDQEVPADFTRTIVDGRGNELIVRPKSRTFIPASVSDNPDLLDSDYQSQVAQMPKHLQDALMGKFSASLADDALQIIPTEWILAAQERWRKSEHKDHGPMTDVGVDVAMVLSEADGASQSARKNDRFVIAPLHHTFFAPPIIRDGAEISGPREGAAAVVAAIRGAPRVKVDVGGGYGKGIVEHLQSNDFDALDMLGGMTSTAMCRDRKFSFKNKRAEWIWRFMEALDPERGDAICLPPGRDVVAELACHRLKRPLGETRVIQVEEKREIVKRLGRSPDVGEAIIYAWAEPDADQRHERRSMRRDKRRGARSPGIQAGYGSAKAKYSPSGRRPRS